VVSRLHLLSEFIADMHTAAREKDICVTAFGVERLSAILKFESAWYGWARFVGNQSLVYGSTTVNLPGSFLKFWSKIESQDLVARALREDRRRVVLYDHRQSTQTEGMMELAERYGIRKWASVMHRRPKRSTGFFVSLYRGDKGGEWEPDDLQLFQCAVDHIFLATQESVGRSCTNDHTTLLVDPAGFMHLDSNFSFDKLSQIWPGWKGEEIPKPLHPFLKRSGNFVLKREGISIACAKDRLSGSQPDLIRIELRPISIVDRLAPREREVARLLTTGATHKEVAGMVGTSPTTVRNQTQVIYEKLGVRTRAQLVELMLKHRENALSPGA
jgi:DNA-binding CsgD family transcriptional regulator